MLSQRMCRFFCTYYRVLQVPDDATQAEIKNSYLELVKKHHPDAGEITSEEFLKIRKAYQILKNPETRRQYDREQDEADPDIPKRHGNRYYDTQSQYVQTQRTRKFYFSQAFLGLIRITTFGCILVFVLKVVEPMNEKQSIFRGDQNIVSSPQAQETRRKQFAQEMKEKKFSANVIEMRVSNGSAETTKSKKLKKSSLESIAGICKMKPVKEDKVETREYM